ncbi:DNA methyltransferase [Mesorhizobium sp. B2-1-3A]|uniref:class I SAM-dependent DNA methyltransferase n=1 Tax=Mesorhizobium sp. B2-1-3A TaxID=2589971 RepID=UPI00112B7A3F|nr:DNA methyltransferase [Mesorhizobium sp. B2-1-3A]TPM99521.1 class I SAM-dependent DNA methyltransferase [Mesorhizobium sp. B2-1-3A]
MTPQAFIAKWQNSQLKERAAAQEHFLDLCRMLDEPTPAEADPTGKDYGFEVGASKSTGGNGFADVFKRGYFGWEYKGTRANLDTAYAQLQRYAVALDNPPLLIVSDIGTTIRIHTNWTNSVSKSYEIFITDLNDPEKRGVLKSALSDPEALRPQKTRQELTEQVAGEFANLARSLRDRGHIPEKVAHFINRMVFCMFAEDVKLLPDMMFTRMLDRAMEDPSEFESFARDLFVAMKSGGRVGFEKVAWFNGGLFDDDLVFALTKDEIKLVHRAASQYWGDVDPSILGTLFERGLDPDKRSQLGAHYTDRDKIMMIINPVIVKPLLIEWEMIKQQIESLYRNAQDERARVPERQSDAKKVYQQARRKEETSRRKAVELFERFLVRLRDYRVLDPACGSGNFLYLALKALKDIEHRASLEMEALSASFDFPHLIPPPATGPENVLGIEINPYAAELARVSVWIGEIQWMLKNGFAASQNPVLKPLDNIECRDAVLTDTEKVASWPPATVVVGNPPFLGNKKMNRVLGQKYVAALRRSYSNRVSSGTDLVMYWFRRAGELVENGQLQGAGLVGTQAIRRGANRKVLDKITSTGRIFDAWSDERWTVDGAAVRVSLVCFDRSSTGPASLDGKQVNRISSDLVATDEIDDPRALAVNRRICFQGTISGGPFEIPGDLARAWIASPINPNGRPNADVLRPWRNADDITSRSSDTWIIVFPDSITEQEASLYERPFEHLKEAWRAENARREREDEKPLRDGEPRSQARWWLLQRSRPKLSAALTGRKRYIATSRVGKHRAFVWLDSVIVPDTRLVVVAKDCDVTFGILQSRIHTLWSLRYGARHGVGNDPEYVHTRTFETFPFPGALTPNVPTESYSADAGAIAIAEAARRLDELRQNWLNPPDLVRREPEVIAGFPDRIVPVSEEAAKRLKGRTMTNLYNERPAWLQHAHKTLDDAVAAIYGWQPDQSDDEILARLFALNQGRASQT